MLKAPTRAGSKMGWTRIVFVERSAPKARCCPPGNCLSGTVWRTDTSIQTAGSPRKLEKSPRHVCRSHTEFPESTPQNFRNVHAARRNQLRWLAADCRPMPPTRGSKKGYRRVISFQSLNSVGLVGVLAPQIPCAPLVPLDASAPWFCGSTAAFL
jgi:hypothetical protein